MSELTPELLAKAEAAYNKRWQEEQEARKRKLEEEEEDEPEVETVKDRGATDPLPRTSSCERVSRLNIKYTVPPVSQPKSVPIGKVMRWGKLLTDRGPGYYINPEIANCRKLKPNECRCLGLLNFLMKKHGYAYVSNPQLAHWLGLNKPNSADNMLRKLIKAEFIENISDQRGKHKLVVRPKWRDKEKGSTNPDGDCPF